MKPEQPLQPNKTKYYMMHPEKFVQDKPKAYAMLQENGPPLVRIPKMGDRLREDEDGNISFVIGRETDAETGEIQEETVVIGHDVSGHLPGMMLTTEAYLDYFDLFGVLHTDPMRKDNKDTSSSAASFADESVGDCPQVTHDENESNGDCPQVTHFGEKNKIVVGGVTLVRIPDLTALPGAEGIIRILPPNEQGISQVEYIHDQWYDPVKKQPRNKKTRIGHISPEFPGAMIPNDRYFRKFNSETGIPFGYRTPEDKEKMRKFLQEVKENAAEMRREAEEAKRRQEENERLKAIYGENSPELAEAAAERLGRMFAESRSKSYDEDPETCDNADDLPMENPEDMDEADENNENEAETGDQMSAENEDHPAMFGPLDKQRERDAVISRILDATMKSIANQAKKHPDALINVYKTRKINDLLIEIKLKYRDSGYEDLLELIEEPQEVEEDGVKYLTGMTYSDVEVLLNHYTTVIALIRQDGKK